MNTRTRDQGSALILALVIVILILGVGGAFMSESLYRAKTQVRAIEADRALMMCDAGLERARRALYTYRVTDTWKWNEILQYCYDNPADPKWTPKTIREDFKANATSSLYKNYRALLGDGDDSKELTLNVKDSVLPSSKTSPSSSDAAAGVPFGANIPYLNGALFIKVHDDDDGDSNLLVDVNNKLLVTITATLIDGTQRQIEGHVEFVIQKMTVNGLAAVVSKDDVAVNGNITIDGRDWDLAGDNVVGPGVFGIVGEATINPDSGGPQIGGLGIAPPKNDYEPSAIKPGHTFTGGYPPDPDTSIGLKPGTLKGLAQSGGGYFNTQASYDAYLKANGGELPGGKIYYLDFDPDPAFSVGDYKKPKKYNDDPSIMVVHTDTTSATIKNLHGGFKGLLLADSITHVNANTEILGMMQVFSPTASLDGNVLGNGGAMIKFSSEALAKLPTANPDSVKLLSWRKIVPQDHKKE